MKVVTKLQLMEKDEFQEKVKMIVPMKEGASVSLKDIIHATTVMTLQEVKGMGINAIAACS